MWFCGLGEPGPVNCSLQMCLSCIFLFIWNWSATHFSNWPLSTIFMALVIRGTLFTSSPQPSLLQAEWSWPSTSNLADSTIVWVSLFSLLLQNHHASLGDHNYTLHWTCLRIAPREDILFFFFWLPPWTQFAEVLVELLTIGVAFGDTGKAEHLDVLLIHQGAAGADPAPGSGESRSLPSPKETIKPYLPFAPCLVTSFPAIKWPFLQSCGSSVCLMVYSRAFKTPKYLRNSVVFLPKTQSPHTFFMRKGEGSVNLHLPGSLNATGVKLLIQERSSQKWPKEGPVGESKCFFPLSVKTAKPIC